MGPPVPAMFHGHIAAVDAILSQPQPDAIRDGEITRILPHLLLGDAEAAWDAERLRAHCVTHVLNVAGSFASSRTSAHRICAQYRQIDAQDDVRYAMLANHWEEAWAFIESARRAGGVCLLHCMSGVNRSGIIAVAALMESTRMPLLDAIGTCKASRGCLLTNTAFREQLVHFAREPSERGRPCPSEGSTARGHGPPRPLAHRPSSWATGTQQSVPHRPYPSAPLLGSASRDCHSGRFPLV